MMQPEQPTDDPSATPEWTAERVTTGKAGRYVVAAALLGGGVALGATLSPVSLAGAQTSADTDTDGADADESTDDAADEDEDADNDDAADEDEDRSDRRGRRGHRGQRVETAAEILGMTTDELRTELRAGSTLAELAAEQGVSEEELVAGLLAAAEAKVDEAVADGRLDADEAEDRLASAAERIEAMIDGEIDRDGERGERRGRGRGHGRFGLNGLSDAIESLGITADEARAGLAEGKSLAEVAGEQGVSEEDLVAALVAAAEERVDEALAAERIDADRAEEIKASIADRVAALIDPTGGDRGHHGEGETVERSFSA